MPVGEFFEAESCMHRSKGHCMTMGTASTMASLVEALGMSLPGNAAIAAVDARRNTLAQLTGRRIVEMVNEDLRIWRILTRQAFENAIRANAAIGGSTNAVIHLIASVRTWRAHRIQSWSFRRESFPTPALLGSSLVGAQAGSPVDSACPATTSKPLLS